MATITTADDLEDTYAITTPAGQSLVTMLGFSKGRTITQADVARWNKITPATRKMTAVDPTNGFVGVLSLTPKNRLVHLLKLGECVDDAGVEMVLGTSSNNAASPDIKFAKKEIFKSVLTICTKEYVTKGAIVGDVPLDRDDEKVKQLLPDELLAQFKPEDKLFVARTPIVHPIPGGIGTLCKGDASDQTVQDALDEWGGDAAINWLFNVQLWDEDIQKQLLADEDLKQYLPKPTGSPNKVYASSPYVKLTGVDEDDSELVRADEHRREILAKLLADEDSGPPSQILSPANLGGPRVDPTAASSPLAATIPKPDKFGSAKRIFKARALLLTPKWEDGNEKRLLSTKPTELAHMMATTATSKAEMTQCVNSGNTSIVRAFGESRNYDMRCVEFPKLEQVMQSFLGQCLFQSKPPKNLQAKSLEGIAFHVLLPDTVESLEKKSKIHNEAIAEEALDESNEKRTKKSTTFTPVDSIAGLETVLKTLTNLLSIIAMFSDFDMDATEAKHKWPILARWIKKCCDAITNEEAKEWQAKYGDKVEGVQLAYFIVNSWNNILSKVATVMNDPVQQAKVLEDDWIGVKVEGFLKAKKQFTHMMDIIENVYGGQVAVPDSTLWKESADKLEHDKIETMLLKKRLNINSNPGKQSHQSNTNTTPHQGNLSTKTKANGMVTPAPNAASNRKSARPKLHDDPASLGTDGKDGYIVGSGPMGGWSLPSAIDGKRPTDPGQQPAFSLCKKHYKKGITCTHGQSCNRSHKPPKELEPTHFKALWEFMRDNTHNLSWNQDLVNVEDLRQKYASLTM